MKKIISLSLALLMVLTMPCTAFASEAPSEMIVESFSLNEIVKAPSVTIPDDKTSEMMQNASADEHEIIIESFSLDEITQAPSITVLDGMGYAYQQFTFDGCEYNEIWSDMNEYTMSEGETGILKISRCIWTPTTNKLYIGFYNVDTAKGYAYSFTGGDISGTYTYSDLPAGRYIVYVRNMGSKAITDGTMRYDVG